VRERLIYWLPRHRLISKSIEIRKAGSGVIRLGLSAAAPVAGRPHHGAIVGHRPGLGVFLLSPSLRARFIAVGLTD
jgi:hypothetical protein